MIIFDNINKQANSGSELMMKRVQNSLPDSLLKHFSIGRAIKLFQEDTLKLYWTHNLPGQMRTEEIPEIKILGDSNPWQHIDGVICVSEFQKQQYLKFFNLHRFEQKFKVLKNSIFPIEPHKKPENKINLIYTSVPERGLVILYYSIDKLYKKYPELNFEVNVFSSYKIYGNQQKEREYLPLYEMIKNHPRFNYFSTVSNELIREKLKESHIFAYPSTYIETSCLSLIEAMSAGCVCVFPNLGALKETSNNYGYIYEAAKSKQQHIDIFSEKLEEAIFDVKNNSIKYNIKEQIKYVNLEHNFDFKKIEWQEYLEGFLNEN